MIGIDKQAVAELRKQVREASNGQREHNDCAVVALAVGCGVPYEKAHAALARAGRKHRKGTPFALTRKAAEALGFQLEEIQPNGCFLEPDARGVLVQTHRVGGYSARTVTTAAKDPALNKGPVLVRVRGHILAMLDGHVCDWTEGRRHRIRHCYRVVPVPADDNEIMKNYGVMIQRPLF